MSINNYCIFFFIKCLFIYIKKSWIEFIKRPLCIEGERGDKGLFRSWNEAVKLVLEAK